MKNLTKEDAERARELFDELQERFNELKDLINGTLERHDRDQFKYNCLGHCEPGLFEEHEWVTRYSGIKSLESWVQAMEDEIGSEDAEIDEMVPLIKKIAEEEDSTDILSTEEAKAAALEVIADQGALGEDSIRRYFRGEKSPERQAAEEDDDEELNK